MLPNVQALVSSVSQILMENLGLTSGEHLDLTIVVLYRYSKESSDRVMQRIDCSRLVKIEWSALVL